MQAGTLWIVATPIGNLDDLAPRAVAVLRAVALVACENTRHSAGLFARFGIGTPTLPLHEHNEREAADRVLARLRAGDSVALVSDAGTPGISDPGALLVAAAHRDGLRVVPVPGANAAVAAYSAAGFDAGRFLFAGFLPAKPGKALEDLDLPFPVILYEAPHRVLATVQALLERFGPERDIAIARELSKKFEEVARMKLADAPGWLEAGPHRQAGEFVLVLGPGAQKGVDRAEAERILKILLEKLPAGEAAKLAARITGVPRNELYKAALQDSK